MTTDVRSPGGWLNLLNTRIGRVAVIGTAVLGMGSLAVYGQLQGRGASQYVEQELNQVAAADTMIAAVDNPLQQSMTGVIIPNLNSSVCFEETPSTASTLDIGLSDADGEGDSDALFDGLVPEADKCFTLFGSGAYNTPSRIAVAPSNYTGSASHITFRWKTGSGQTASGNPSGFARIEIQPCTENVPCN